METKITNGTTTFTVDNSATGIIERLLREGSITAKEAMTLLQEMAGKNNNNSPWIPTYPSYPIICSTPSSNPPGQFYCTSTI